MSNNPILSTRCDYLCCQRQNQKGGAGEQGGELPVQDQRGGQVRSQREVLGHVQEARQLQEDESVLRSVQLGNRGHTEGAEGAEQTDVRIQQDHQVKHQLFSPHRFRGTAGPTLETTVKAMKVFFKSNRKKHGTGATCTVECV